LLHDAAELRAMQLLKQLLKERLSRQQRAQYENHASFDVVGGGTGTQYRIHRGRELNVEQLDKCGKRVRLLCFRPRGDLPVGDVMLAQKMALELFESDALKVAHARRTAIPRPMP
jgi:hypothetical protein